MILGEFLWDLSVQMHFKGSTKRDWRKSLWGPLLKYDDQNSDFWELSMRVICSNAFWMGAQQEMEEKDFEVPNCNTAINIEINDFERVSLRVMQPKAMFKRRTKRDGRKRLWGPLPKYGDQDRK